MWLLAVNLIFAEEALACGALDGFVGEALAEAADKPLVDRLALVDLALFRKGL